MKKTKASFWLLHHRTLQILTHSINCTILVAFTPPIPIFLPQFLLFPPVVNLKASWHFSPLTLDIWVRERNHAFYLIDPTGLRERVATKRILVPSMITRGCRIYLDVHIHSECENTKVSGKCLPITRTCFHFLCQYIQVCRGVSDRWNFSRSHPPYVLFLGIYSWPIYMW